jgi:DNA-binding LacI/PurR family transcriptional regulator
MMSNPFYQAFLKGVESVIQHNNTLAFVCSTYDDPSLAWRYFAQLIASGVDGVISVSHDMSDFIQSGTDLLTIPLVIADFPSNFSYSVELDHEQSGFLSTEHLVQHGYRRIALVRYALDNPAVLQIQCGYETALRKAGLPILPEYIILANSFDRVAGEDAALRLLALPERPEAVFIIADQLAIGAIQAFQHAGVNVPEDIAVTSFNNIPEAALITPSLTSVAAPAEQLGKTTMHMLNELITGQVPKQKNVLLPCPELIIRQSCGCHLS